MPNYNHGRYLRSALGAILSQSARPLEVLVIDDASTDDSIDVVREIAAQDPVVRLLVNPRNTGPIPTINRGVREAAGDFIYMTAADDQILPGFFEKSMTLLAQNPTAKLSLADLAQFDAVTGRVRFLRPRLRPDAGYVGRDGVADCMAHRRVYMYGGMTIINRATFLDLGGLSPALKWYSDWFCVLVLALRHGACYVPEPLATMRMLPGAYSAAGRKDRAVQDELFRRIFDLLRSDQYADVWSPIRESGALCLLGSQILRVLLTDPRYRDILSPRLLLRLLANIPVTLFGLNPAMQSPLGFLDRTVRKVLGLDGTIQQYGVPLDKPGE
jgi:glycosyltransferase involved in cell wall biosynthesis